MTSCKHNLSQPPRPGKPRGREAELLRALINGLDQPEAVISKAQAGPSLVAIQAGERLGLSSHLGAGPGEGEKDLLPGLLGMTCREAAGLILKENAFSVALGVAALNAGLLPQAQPEKKPIERLVSELGHDKEAALVGRFPFTEWLKGNVGKLHLFELEPADDRVPRSQWEKVLAKVSVAAVTGTVILTRHAAYFLDNTPKAVRIMVGPSTPLSPVLFDFGADILAGSVVTDPERVLAGVHKGGCFSDVFKAGGIEFMVKERPGLNIL